MLFLRAALVIALCGPALAQDGSVQLHADEEVIASGLLKFALPRFLLKTSVKIEYVAADAAEIVIDDMPDGDALFTPATGNGRVYRVAVLRERDAVVR